MLRGWLDSCRRNGWTIGTQLRHMDIAPASNVTAMPLEKYERLKRKLLEVAGQAVCLRYEEDIIPITNRGQFFRGYNARKMRGDPCQCHSNSANLWDRNRDKLSIATGYALSDDGMWRQHTWCVDRDNRVVETTEDRLLYFGFLLSYADAEQFFQNNP